MKHQKNHIDYYEAVKNEEGMEFEIKCLIEQFYKMDMDRARKALEIIMNMMDAKFDDLNCLRGM